MTRGSILTIVLLTSAAVWQRSEAGCDPPTPIPCDPENKCKTGWVCLGPDGNKICHRCRCNHPRECELDSKGYVACNCKNSNGYTGDFCKCPPVGPACDDIYLLNSGCSDFSDEFETVQDTALPENAEYFLIYEEVHSLEYCKQKCIEHHGHVFTFARDMCTVYTRAYTIPLKNILSEFIENSDSELHIRKCNQC